MIPFLPNVMARAAVVCAVCGLSMLAATCLGADSVAAGAPPTAHPASERSLLGVHPRSRRAITTVVPRPQEPRVLPPIRESTEQDRLDRLAKPYDSRVVAEQDDAPCDVQGFGERTGAALSELIRDTAYGCLNELFSDAPLSLRSRAFRRQNMVDVSASTVALMDAYEGKNTDHLYSKHFLFLRIGFYNQYGDPDHFDWSDDRSALVDVVNESVSAFLLNEHFFDYTDTHCETAWEVFSMVDGSAWRTHWTAHLPRLKAWLRMLERHHIEELISDELWDEGYEVVAATNVIFHILFRASDDDAFLRSVSSDFELIQILREFALQDYMVGTEAELVIDSAGNILSHFLDEEALEIYDEVVSAIGAILDHYDPFGEGAGIWISTAGAVFYEEKCALFDICGVDAELEEHILTSDHLCESVDVRIVGQSLTEGQLNDACGLMRDAGDRFHQLLDTGRMPVPDDYNERLEVIVYQSSYSYETYSGLFYGNETDNGGIYYEGDPADPNNVARFFAYMEGDEDERYIRNLEHEYTHYLDLRFNIHGDFSLEYDTLWWIEGIAEYIQKRNDYPRAIELAKGPRPYSFDELFKNTYDHGVDRVYRWGYLAVRFIIERHPGDVGLLLGYLRSGCFDEFERYQQNEIASSYDAEWREWLGTVEAASDFPTDRGVRRRQVVCGVTSEIDLATLRLADIFPVGASSRFDLRQHFRDLLPDGGEFTVSSSNPQVATGSLDGGLLTVATFAPGEAVIRITLGHQGRSVTGVVRVTVTAECPPSLCRPWNRGWRQWLRAES